MSLRPCTTRCQPSWHTTIHLHWIHRSAIQTSTTDSHSSSSRTRLATCSPSSRSSAMASSSHKHKVAFQDSLRQATAVRCRWDSSRPCTPSRQAMGILRAQASSPRRSSGSISRRREPVSTSVRRRRLRHMLPSLELLPSWLRHRSRSNSLRT